MLHQLTPIGLLDTSLHSRHEASLTFKHPVDRLFHQLLGILTIGGGHLSKPRYHIGREVYFHIPKPRCYGEVLSTGVPRHPRYLASTPDLENARNRIQVFSRAVRRTRRVKTSKLVRRMRSSRPE